MIRVIELESGKLVYQGEWDKAPQGAVKTYLDSVAKHHGAENVENYLRFKDTPLALLYKGFNVEVL